MAPLVRDALKALETAVELPKFEPGSSTRKFTIAANDFTTMVIGAQSARDSQRRGGLSSTSPSNRLTRIESGGADRPLAGSTPRSARSRAVPQRSSRTSCSGMTTCSSPMSAQKLGRNHNGDTCDAFHRRRVFWRRQEGAIDGFISERGLARRSEMYDRTAFENAFSPRARSRASPVSLPHFLALPAVARQFKSRSDRARPLAEFIRRNLSRDDLRAALSHHSPRGAFALATNGTRGMLPRTGWHETIRRATNHLRVDAAPR